MTNELDETIRRAMAELIESAPPAPPLVHPPAIGPVPARRPRTVAVVAAFVSVAALVAVGALVLNGRSSASHPDVLTGHPTSTTATGKSVDGSAASLAHGRWNSTRVARDALSNGSMVWTGKKLIVWGGIDGPHGFGSLGTGAEYDPFTDRWTELPKAPIAPRGNQSAIWTGIEMIVWGGVGYGTGPTLDDGAAFNPVTNTWRKLAPSPLTPMSTSTAVWDDREMVVLGMNLDQTTGTTSTHVGAYDPTNDTWRLLSSIPVAADVVDSDLRAIATGSKIMVFVEGNQVAQTHPEQGVPAGAGINIFSLDPGSGKWSTIPPPVPWATNVSGLAWTGTELVGTFSNDCWACAAPDTRLAKPSQPVSVTYRLNPATGEWRTVAPQPGSTADDEGAPSVWTGRALVRVGTHSGAWDPVTNRWTNVPNPPAMGTVFWTTQGLLVITGTNTGRGELAQGVIGYRFTP